MPYPDRFYPVVDSVAWVARLAALGVGTVQLRAKNLNDSEALQMVSDAQVLSQFASSVIYVVKADSTPYQVAQNGLKKLRRVNARVLGVVLNQLDLEKAEKYYGEYSGYKSYRGYKKYGYKKYGYGRTYGAD